MIKEAAVVVGTGHLGVHLADQLVKEGREVRVLAYNCAPVPKVIGEMVKRREVKVCMGDILKPETLMEAFRNAGVVYLAAAYICLLRDWERMEAVNVRGVENVTRVARCEGVPKVIYFSSIHAMKQEPIDQKLDEKRELIPISKAQTYGESKAEGERLAMRLMNEGLVGGCILSPTGMIGPMDYVPSEFGQVLVDLMHGRMPTLVNAGMDWVDVRDVAQAALVAEETAGNGEKFILSGHYVHMKDTATAVSEASGIAAPEWYIPLWMAKMFAPMALRYAQLTHQRPLFTPYSIEALSGNRHISHKRATKELGFIPRPHTETVRDTVKWFGKNGT